MRTQAQILNELHDVRRRQRFLVDLSEEEQRWLEIDREALIDELRDLRYFEASVAMAA